MTNTIPELQKLVGDINKANGWRETQYDDLPAKTLAKVQIGLLALIDTEVSEAIEEIRNGRAVDEVYYSAKTSRGTIESTSRQEIIELTSLPPKPEGVPSELADVVIRALDLADAWGIDLNLAIAEKLDYNQTRGYRHGGKSA